MSQADRIIKEFGGITAMARALNHKNPSTVQGWAARGFIPPKQHQAVWDAAVRDGIKIELHDLAAVSIPSDPAPASERAA